VKLINVKKIDASPFQHRKYMDEEKLKELALSIQRDGLIQPIVVRSRNGRFQLIAGERRWRAVRDYTDLKAIEARVIRASDLKARRIAAAENLQRENLSAVEKVEYMVDIVDSELIRDKEYASMGKEPVDRVKTLLGKLKASEHIQIRGYNIGNDLVYTAHKFMRRVEKVFKNLPNPLKWRSFYENDLPLITDFCEDIQGVSIRHQLNRSQTRALKRLKDASEQEFQKIKEIDLKDLSAREIEDIALKAAKRENHGEFDRARRSISPGLKATIFLMHRLDIPVNRIASRLKKDRKTPLRYFENLGLVKSVRNALKNGEPVHKVAKEMDCPEPLIWSIALEGKTDQERFQALGWGLRTWDYWYFNDVDQRFGDDWPGRIPAQMIGHILFYFSKQGDLVFDPMAGGGVVPDTCLALNRKCWSFDMADRIETRPEIEPWYWDMNNLKWPVRGKALPDLILFDPPYFSKRAKEYDEGSISGLSREGYLEFLENFFRLAHENSKERAVLALINADWRDFQGTPAIKEKRTNSILVDDYTQILKKSGWESTHIILSPMSSERFNAGVVAAMQKKRILGVTSRYIIIAKMV